MRIILSFIAACILTFSSHAQPATPPAKYQHVNVFYMNDGQSGKKLYNATNAYSGTISYYIDPSIDKYSIELGGKTILISGMRDVINRSMGTWGVILLEYITIKEVQSYSDANLYIGAAKIPSESGQFFGYTIARMLKSSAPLDARAKKLSGRQDASHDERGFLFLDSPLPITQGLDVFLKKAFDTNDVQDAIRHIAYYTMMHEMGHALGLAHPQMPNNVVGWPTKRRRLGAVDKNPLMEANPEDYLNGLSLAKGGKPLGDADIVPSWGEKQVLFKCLASKIQSQLDECPASGPIYFNNRAPTYVTLGF